MKLAYFYGNAWWCRVHRDGCRDTAKEHARDGVDGDPRSVYTTEAATQRAAIEEVAHDFIFWNDEQPWTDYIGQVVFAPCVDLPLE